MQGLDIIFEALSETVSYYAAKSRKVIHSELLLFCLTADRNDFQSSCFSCVRKRNVKRIEYVIHYQIFSGYNLLKKIFLFLFKHRQPQREKYNFLSNFFSINNYNDIDFSSKDSGQKSTSRYDILQKGPTYVPSLWYIHLTFYLPVIENFFDSYQLSNHQNLVHFFYNEQKCFWSM